VLKVVCAAAICVVQGHYCPAVANRIYKDAELGRGPAVNLKGVAIGNGMTNPAVQYAAYADFALQNNLISQSVSADGTSSACAAAPAGAHRQHLHSSLQINTACQYVLCAFNCSMVGSCWWKELSDLIVLFVPSAHIHVAVDTRLNPVVGPPVHLGCQLL
jgi:hypothetical protein